MLSVETARERAVPAARRSGGNLWRITKYTLVKGTTLLITVIIAVYLTILIANMGGYVDKMRESELRFQIAEEINQNEELRLLTVQERKTYEEEVFRVRAKQLGLDRPFIVKSFIYLWNGLTLNLGRAIHLTSDAGSAYVDNIIGERLAPTLLVMASSQLLLFFSAMFFALFLSRRYGSRLDRLVVAMAPTSAAPAWFYGIFLIMIFAAVLHWLPFGGMIDAPPPPGFWAKVGSIIKHLILPISAFVASNFWLSSYYWRTFFLIHSSEDYVDMAKAKGLTGRAIERRYVLRPTLPTIITSFAMTLIGLWTGAIVFETVFNWPGLGRLTQQAINVFETPVIVGVTVIYAYLLALTLFLLDIIYAIVDPRVKLGGGANGS